LISTYIYVLGSSYGFVSSCWFFSAEKKGANPTVDGKKKDDAPIPSESKNSKKKKNKIDKS
jgi:hypothetical protein